MKYITEGARVFFSDKSFVVRFMTDGTWSEEIKQAVVEREMQFRHNRGLAGQYRIEYFQETR